MSGDETFQVINDPGSHRYTITVDGENAGFAKYLGDSEVLTFVHTEIDPRFQGRGLGNRLAADALDDVRERGLRVVPRCSFIAAFIDQHPDYQALVAPA